MNDGLALFSINMNMYNRHFEDFVTVSQETGEGPPPRRRGRAPPPQKKEEDKDQGGENVHTVLCSVSDLCDSK